MTKFRDFWDKDIPQELLDLGFVDRAWHNDAGPKMVHCLQLNLDDGENKVPMLNIMVGGEAQADEMGNNDLAYMAYWTINGADPAPNFEEFYTADYQRFLTYLREDALPLLAQRTNADR